MKMKNISLGDSVQVKKGLACNIFKAKQVCEVIKIDSEHEFRPDVLIKGEFCLGWVNHKDLKKPIHHEPEPQLKQLDQSIFNGLDKKWRFAMVSSVGIPFVYDYKPTGKRHFISDKNAQLMINLGKVMRIDEYDYDTTDWKNSLIERDIAKELLEIDLSSELTGSELCRAMLARGDKFVMCAVSMADDETALSAETVTLNRIVISLDKEWLYTDTGTRWHYAIPINNQGEPLTASEVGL